MKFQFPPKTILSIAIILLSSIIQCASQKIHVDSEVMKVFIKDAKIHEIHDIHYKHLKAILCDDAYWRTTHGNLYFIDNDLEGNSFHLYINKKKIWVSGPWSLEDNKLTLKSKFINGTYLVKSYSFDFAPHLKKPYGLTLYLDKNIHEDFSTNRMHNRSLKYGDIERLNVEIPK
ncbi:MAG TPA: hypothetical protein PLI62_06390 [Spirochaetota bacterium]|nr:hypothetical protein [Spirochaetota bacterium]HQP49143.1 hypothetical protein [Spirochaetota bacterium]